MPLAPAPGDPQVSPLTIEIVARSGIGIETLGPYRAGPPPPLIEPRAGPLLGSALALWDFGNPLPPPGAQPPPPEGGDPHEAPRNDPAHNRQMIHFWRSGEVLGCGGSPCAPGARVGGEAP